MLNQRWKAINSDLSKLHDEEDGNGSQRKSFPGWKDKLGDGGGGLLGGLGGLGGAQWHRPPSQCLLQPSQIQASLCLANIWKQELVCSCLVTCIILKFLEGSRFLWWRKRTGLSWPSFPCLRSDFAKKSCITSFKIKIHLLIHKPLEQVVGVLAGLVVAILLLGFLIQFWRERERKSTSEKVKPFFSLLKTNILTIISNAALSYVPHEPAGLAESGWERWWKYERDKNFFCLLELQQVAHKVNFLVYLKFWSWYLDHSIVSSSDQHKWFHFRFKGTLATLSKTDQVMTNPTWSEFQLFESCWFCLKVLWQLKSENILRSAFLKPGMF